MSVTLAILTVLGAAVLAFANGANDVSKGVATLAGTGRTSYGRAIAWGTLWTFAGGLASLVISVGLVKAFTSAIVGPDVLSLPVFPLAVAAGAAAWVIFASSTGLPVSTTHALTGAIVGVALMAGGVGSVSWWVLLAAIAAPLALSPLISAAVGYGTYAVAARVSPVCVCIREDTFPNALGADGTSTGAFATRMVVSTCTCAAGGGSLSGRSLSDGIGLAPASMLHWGAAAALSFARGVNDNAKIAAIGALGLTAVHADLWIAFVGAAVAMAIGSYAAGLRVTRTLGEQVVRMDHDTGLAASLVSAALVLAASFYALPVSTTHVATGAIVGAGLRQDPAAVRWREVGGLMTAWIVTLPIAGALAALAAWTLGVDV
jgi:PiT family inorganic phosphate transporter